MDALFNTRNLSVGYGNTTIIDRLDLRIETGEVTTLIGPNGCGKSTLLKAMSALLGHTGTLEFLGRPLEQWGRKERARALTLLPQSPVAPGGLTVAQLISRGRHPYQNWLAQWSDQDSDVVNHAMEITRVGHLASRQLADLSGGQRQRVWIAMAIAQDTPALLLDEPTTFLDLATSVDVLRLVRELCDTQGRSVVMVLHDLNLAGWFSDRLILLNAEGSVAASGKPEDVFTEELLREVFGLDAIVVVDPVSGGPLVVPR